MLAQEEIKQTDVSEIPPYKLYSLSGVVIVSIFGSILAGGILMGLNYQRLGKTKEAKKTYGYTVIATLVGSFTAMMLADDSSATSFAASSVVALGWVMHRLQGPMIAHHLANHGVMESNWKAFGITFLVATGVFILLIFILALFS